jgi:hypothetical protein
MELLLQAIVDNGNEQLRLSQHVVHQLHNIEVLLDNYLSSLTKQTEINRKERLSDETISSREVSFVEHDKTVIASKHQGGDHDRTVALFDESFSREKESDYTGVKRRKCSEADIQYSVQVLEPDINTLIMQGDRNADAQSIGCSTVSDRNSSIELTSLSSFDTKKSSTPSSLSVPKETICETPQSKIGDPSYVNDKILTRRRKD